MWRAKILYLLYRRTLEREWIRGRRIYEVNPNTVFVVMH